MTTRRNINNKLNSSTIVSYTSSSDNRPLKEPASRKETSLAISPQVQGKRNQAIALAEVNPEIPRLVMDSASKAVNQTGKLVSHSGSHFIQMFSNFTDRPGASSVKKTIFSFVPLGINIFAISRGLNGIKDFLQGNPRQSIGNFINATLLTLMSKDFKHLALSQSSDESKKLITNSLLKLVSFGVIEMSQQLDRGSGRLTKLAPTNSMKWGINNLFNDLFSPIQGIISSALFGRKNNQIATPDIEVGTDPSAAFPRYTPFIK